LGFSLRHAWPDQASVLRSRRSSTNTPFAAAMTDRLRHRSVVLNLDGYSYVSEHRRMSMPQVLLK
jgi:hypothetical protein